ncbi:MAG: hypothetical protein CL843_18410 [Crocinitomicaceae bacterium]|nr:hypothetical protein [Crocinitomicaceae bacterium]|tara:strand:- start:4040 stop:4510 length:471 start_codon:yes stop_codon:yes gene_type:complete
MKLFLKILSRLTLIILISITFISCGENDKKFKPTDNDNAIYILFKSENCSNCTLNSFEKLTLLPKYNIQKKYFVIDSKIASSRILGFSDNEFKWLNENYSIIKSPKMFKELSKDITNTKIPIIIKQNGLSEVYDFSVMQPYELEELFNKKYKIRKQ